MTQVAAEPATTGKDEDDYDHVVCCVDDDMGLCGVDLTGVDWLPSDATPHDCPACTRLETDRAPSGEDGRCVDCPISLFRQIKDK